jgi:hypothetical protein
LGHAQDERDQLQEFTEEVPEAHRYDCALGLDLRVEGALVRS